MFRLFFNFGQTTVYEIFNLHIIPIAMPSVDVSMQQLEP
jgi:hypothetical protein